jgi:hypothetical protein
LVEISDCGAASSSWLTEAQYIYCQGVRLSGMGVDDVFALAAFAIGISAVGAACRRPSLAMMSVTTGRPSS